MLASDQGMLAAIIIVATALILLAAEALWPRRARVQPAPTRWRTHLGFAAINLPVERGVQALVLLALYGAATRYPATPDFGLLTLLDLPLWLIWIIAILALDLAVWFQHWLTHQVPILWRLHRVHHADRDLDVSSALRFHPAEIGLSMLYKMAVALLLGVPLGALVLFEVLLSVIPLFNHANIALPRWLDRALRVVLVTPDMHRIHHSIMRTEQNHNFGFCFAMWDRIFGVYQDDPAAGQTRMTIGLANHQDDAPARLGWSLHFPLDKDPLENE